MSVNPLSRLLSSRYCPLGGRRRPSRVSRTSLKLCREDVRRRNVAKVEAEGGFTTQALEKLCKRQDLTREDTKAVLDELIAESDPAKIGAFLVLMRAKGEVIDEVTGMVECLRDKAIHVDVPFDVVDIVGTGGDGIGSVNISTGASVIAAAAGAKIAKHGNRSVSSQCGSADVLEALGIEIDLGREEVAHCITHAGIGFMFAPRYSPHMKSIKSVRNSLKMRTVFNILGPLLNPAGAEYGLIGVYSPKMMSVMADVLQALSIKRAMIVHSMGLDELTPMGPASVIEVTADRVRNFEIDPLDYGIPRCTVEDLKGGNKTVNAAMLTNVFEGEEGPVADALNLNAGFALAVCGVAKDPGEGIAMAQEIQRSVKAKGTLERWIAVCIDSKSKTSCITK